MTKKKETPYTELDIIMQAHANTTKRIAELADKIHAKYDGGMAMNVAKEAAKDYYILGGLPMEFNPELRKEAEAQVKKHFKEREERLKKLNGEDK